MTNGSTLKDGILAVDRLNSWLRWRADERHRLFGMNALQAALKETVYRVKLEAIKAAQAQFAMALSRVAVEKPCRACNGTGTFYHADAVHLDEGVKCRRCVKGISKLCFVSAEIDIGEAESVRWHTPWQKWFSWSMDGYCSFPSFYGSDEGKDFYLPQPGWDVNKEGKPLSVEQVATDFETVMGVWPEAVVFTVGFHHFAPRGLKRIEYVREWFEGVKAEVFTRISRIDADLLQNGTKENGFLTTN